MPVNTVFSSEHIPFITLCKHEHTANHGTKVADKKSYYFHLMLRKTVINFKYTSQVWSFLYTKFDQEDIFVYDPRV